MLIFGGTDGGELVCPNCHEESNGLKLNNRLYCTECGFLLSDPNSIVEDNPPVIRNEPKATQQNAKKLEEHFQEKEPEPKIIAEDGSENEIAPLEAELEVLDLVEKEATELEEEQSAEAEKEIILPKKLPHTDKTIKKHNRPRTDLKKEGDFVLLPGEPDPIAEPEIEPAKELTTENILTTADDRETKIQDAIKDPDINKKNEAENVEKSSISDQDESIDKKVASNEEVQPKEDLDEITEEKEDKATKENTDEDDFKARQDAPPKAEPKPMIDLELAKHDVNFSDTEERSPRKKNDMLLTYFKKMGEQTKESKKSKKKKRKFNWKIFAISATAVLILFLAVGAGGYLYSQNSPEKALIKAETNTTFSHLKPGYLPAGYVVGKGSVGNSNKITYSYVYSPDESKKLTIVAEKTDIKESEIKSKLIDNTGEEFVNKETEGRSYWLVGDNTIYFLDSNVLYTINGNPDISAEELYKVAEGLK